MVIACAKDEEPDATETPKLILSFDPLHLGNDLQIGERFTNEQGYQVEVLDLTFYLSNISLIRGDSSEYRLSDIELINIRQHQRTIEMEVDAGAYIAIKFDLGVTPAMNGTINPDFYVSIYDTNHPLSESNGMYWGWADGYRFFKFEGRCDTISPGAEILPMSFALHSGQDELYRRLSPFYGSLEISKSSTTLLLFSIDIDKIFNNQGVTIDLANERQYHGGLSPLGPKIANNSAAAFRLIQ